MSRHDVYGVLEFDAAAPAAATSSSWRSHRSCLGLFRRVCLLLFSVPRFDPCTTSRPRAESAPHPLVFMFVCQTFNFTLASQQVGHPLLPSQAVHDPIAKLVAAAGARVQRSDGVDGGGGGHCGAARARVQAELARLLGEVWRKLREESALLDFFLRAEDGEGGSGGGGGGALHLDVFDRLLPLLELRGGAGQQAQEACLVALSVKDARVGRYVRDRTRLASQLAETLTGRYMALYDTLEELQVAAALPVAAAEAGMEEGGPAGGILGLLTQQQPERAEATFTEALSLFLQHLRFCNAVGLVASDTQACLRPSLAITPSNHGGGGGGGTDAVVQAGGCPPPGRSFIFLISSFARSEAGAFSINRSFLC